MNARMSDRYTAGGLATLRASGIVLAGGLADLSMIGVGLRFDSVPDEDLGGRHTWICTLTSNDLSAPVECTVRVVRKGYNDAGTVLGCQIVFIREPSYQMLKQFCSKAATRQ